MKKAIFYHIYPLGLLGAPKTNNFTSAPKDLLVGLYPWLDHIESLGCNALYLGPVFESTSHGYDTFDYFQVDRRLGTNTALRNLVLRAEDQGIKVVLDAVFNHVGRDFWAFKDVQKFGKKSKYKDWFSNIDFTKKSPFGDAFTYDAWSGHYQLVELNLSNHEVKEHLFSAVKHWIADYNISGLRLDAADGIPFDFFEELAAFCKQLKSDFWLMGEVVQGDYNQWVNGNRLDSVTNYNYHTPFYESFNQIDFSYIANILKNQYGITGTYKNLVLYTFVDNHDVNRAASALNKPEHLYPLYLLLFTLPGIPAIYYGSEWGFEGEKHGNSDRLLRPHVNLETLIDFAKHPLLIKAIKKFISIRKNADVLGLGSYRKLLVKKEQFAFLRTYGKGLVIVIINSSSKMETVNIPIPESVQGSYCDLLNSDETFQSVQGQLRIKVPSCWGRILTLLDKS